MLVRQVRQDLTSFKPLSLLYLAERTVVQLESKCAFVGTMSGAINDTLRPARNLPFESEFGDPSGYEPLDAEVLK